MDMKEYQQLAATTDQNGANDSNGMMVALLGLAGETGSLLTLYKKWLRDGDAYQIMKERVAEELGDVLWYVADIATRAGIELDDVATGNTKKASHRWLPSETVTLFDEDCLESERLPRKFVAEFRNFGELNKQKLEVYIDGVKCGSTLTDNAYKGDDYRYHDLLHLAFGTILGWSPVFRALLKRKRRSTPLADEVEDGGRAVAIEEGLAALIFNYARHHSLLKGVSRLDWPLLRTCNEMTSHLEVSPRSLHDWELAILSAFKIWRQMQEHNGGFVDCDLRERTMHYRKPNSSGLGSD
jgi:NTP pyrophosphatase (non-canonical NTP hydrolase)